MYRCEICGREVAPKNAKRTDDGWLCPKHSTQIYRQGAITDKTPYSQRDKNAITPFESVALVALVNRAEGTRQCVIDKDDLMRVRQYKWNWNGKAILCSKPPMTLPKFIMGVVDDKSVTQVRHINGDVFDNRKENLWVYRR